MAQGKKTSKKPQKLEETHGRDDFAKQKRLDEILGNNRSRYKQKTPEDYKNYLQQMNLTDMQNHAHALGLVPISDRKRLETNLIREFTKTTAPYYGSHQVVQQTDGKNISADALRVLATGR